MNEPAISHDIDLDACLRAPVHLSGAIQPHGYLVSCSRADWRIRHVSANVEALFGLPADALLGLPLSEFVEEDVLSQVSDGVAATGPGDATAQRACTANVGALMTICDVTAHAVDGLLHLEFEPQPGRSDALTPTTIAQRMVAQLGHADDTPGFFRQVARQVQRLTGYDRVMVYRFREDDSGEVIAEVVPGDMEPYLGLRYPATDIPPPARALYLRNRIRIIPDATYQPVPLLPPLDADGAPLDLSQHVLRSVAPVHLEYLRNMGVAASMSISIISGGRLWGLIACHNREPRLVPASARAAADLFGMFVSMRVAAREQDETMQRYERAQQVRDALGSRLSLARDFRAALAEELPLLRDTLDSDGAALWLDGRWSQDGRVPGALAIEPLLAWVDRLGRPVLAMTDCMADWRTDALQAEGLAGLLAINLGTPEDWLFLFRREQVEDVRWAGEPAKALVATDDGTRIAPRKSFAEWKQTVHGCSIDWSDSDRRGAERLHRVLREQRRRLLVDEDDTGNLDRLRQHQALRDQKARLQQLSSLVDGLVHLDEAQTSRLDRRIATLEADLRQLIESPSDDLDAAAAGASR